MLHIAMNTLRRLSYTAGKAPAHLVALHVYMQIGRAHV